MSPWKLSSRPVRLLVGFDAIMKSAFFAPKDIEDVDYIVP